MAVTSEWVTFPPDICLVAGKSILQESTPEIPPLIPAQDPNGRDGHTGRCGRPAPWLHGESAMCPAHRDAMEMMLYKMNRALVYPFIPNPDYQYRVEEVPS